MAARFASKVKIYPSALLADLDCFPVVAQHSERPDATNPDAMSSATFEAHPAVVLLVSMLELSSVSCRCCSFHGFSASR